MNMKILLAMLVIAVIAVGCVAPLSSSGGLGSNVTSSSGEKGANESNGNLSGEPSAGDLIRAMRENGTKNADVNTSVNKTGNSQPPIQIQMTPGRVPAKFVKEGDLVTFPNLKAKDPQGAAVTYTFTAPLDSTGKWQTKAGDVGAYKVTITASNGKASSSQDVVIVVQEKNNPPRIEVSDVTVNEGDVLKLKPVVSDPDGDAVTVRYSGWMSADTKEVLTGEAGTHEVTLIASDGKTEVRKTINVIVQHVNRPPKLDTLQEVLQVKEGDKVTVVPTAKDPDKDKLSFTFTPPLDANGTWQTKKGDVGKYRVAVTASDGKLNDTQRLFVVVESVNNPPSLSLEKSNITVNEGETVAIKYTTADADNDSVQVTFTGWMNTSTYIANYNDAGDHEVIVTASDGKEKATKKVNVHVNDVNRPPVFDPGSFQ